MFGRWRCPLFMLKRRRSILVAFTVMLVAVRADAAEPESPAAEPHVVRSLRAAAEAGDASAMVKLGDCYRTGDGVAVDDGQAVSWYSRAVDKGSLPSAMAKLGYMY